MSQSYISNYSLFWHTHGTNFLEFQYIISFLLAKMLTNLFHLPLPMINYPHGDFKNKFEYILFVFNAQYTKMSRLCLRRGQKVEVGTYYLLILTSYSGFPAKKTLNTKFTSYETDKHKCGGCNPYVSAKRAHPPTNLFF